MAIRLGDEPRNLRRRYVPMSEINVTPLVDVMLVLLVVFMITAPLLNVGVPIDLPRASAKPLPADRDPLVLTVDAKGELFLQETPIVRDQLIPRLNAITTNRADTRIFVRGDKAVAYGRVIEIMGELSTAGFSRVALVAEQPPGQPARAATRPARR
jgi:biopolymer transport protein TolR